MALLQSTYALPLNIVDRYYPIKVIDWHNAMISLFSYNKLPVFQVSCIEFVHCLSIKYTATSQILDLSRNSCLGGKFPTALM